MLKAPETGFDLIFAEVPSAAIRSAIGLFNMASLGLRAFSGISGGLIGSLIGIHWSLALSALAAMTIAAMLLLLTRRRAVE